MGLITRLFVGTVLALSLAAALAPRGALAQRRGDPRERQARALFEQGEAAYEEGRYEEAVAAFEQAYGLSARPLLLYNIANAQERLGLLTEALQNLRYYLEDAPDDERPVIERRLRGLEDRVARQDREEAERRAEQERIARTAAEAAATAAVRDGRAQTAPDGPAPPILGWTLTLGGGALVATGVLFGVLALGARTDAEALCSEVGSTTFCPVSADSALSSDSTYSLLADIGVIAGVAAAAFGVYLVVTHESEPAPPPRIPGMASLRAPASAPRLALGVGPLAGGATLLLRGAL
jgi:tetratricopeptide (TPR) repeat protein